jgi:hypothetical protein
VLKRERKSDMPGEVLIDVSNDVLRDAHFARADTITAARVCIRVAP